MGTSSAEATGTLTPRELAAIAEANASGRKPVIFIHGIWLHATSWCDWLELFGNAGYAPLAPGWPGDPETVQEAREHSEGIASIGVKDVTEHHANIVRRLWRSPILIGHSFGGLIAQRLLGMGLGSGAVAIDAAPIKGVLPLPISQLKAIFPVLKSFANINRVVPLTEEQFRCGFSNAVSCEESAELHRKWTIPAPGRPLFSGAVASFSPNSPAEVDTHNPSRGPLLLIAGGKDQTIPPIVTHTTHRLYRESPAITEVHEFADRGHSLTIDSGWREVAQYSLDWLKQRSLGAA